MPTGITKGIYRHMEKVEVVLTGSQIALVPHTRTRTVGCAIFSSRSLATALALSMVPFAVSQPYIGETRESLDDSFSTTELSTQTLLQLGLSSYSEAMRLVPGMIVTHGEGIAPAVTYHGGQQDQPRRVQTFLDSLPLARSTISNVKWGSNPVDFDDVQFIQVTRGSSLMSFGSSAFQGAVNLISKDALDEEGGYIGAKIEDGGHHESAGYAQMLTPADLIIVSAHTDKNLGYDSDTAGNRGDDGERHERAYGQYQHFTDTGYVRIQSGAHHANAHPFINHNDFSRDRSRSYENEHYFFNATMRESIETAGTPLVTTTSLYASRFSDVFTYHRVYPNGFFFPESRAYDASPSLDLVNVITQYEQTGIPVLPMPTTSNDSALTNSLLARFITAGAQTFEMVPGTDVDDYKDETVAFDERLKWSDADDIFSSTLHTGIKRYRARSKTYYGGTFYDTTSFLAEKVTMRATPNLILGAGFVAQKKQSRDKVPISRQASITYRPLDNTVMRLNHSVTYRQPDNIEANVHWIQYVTFDPGHTDLDGNREATVFRTNIGKGDSLQDERLETVEASLRQKISHRADFELKVFHENMTNVIAEPFYYFYFNPTNDGHISNDGAEMSIDAQFAKSRLGIVYTYLDQESATIWTTPLYARHVGGCYAIFNLTDTLTLAVAHYSNSAISTGAYDRSDITLTSNFDFGDDELILQILAKRYNDHSNELFNPNAADSNMSYKTIDPAIRYAVNAEYRW